MKKLREIRVHNSTFIGVTFLFGLLMIIAVWKFSFASYAMDLDDDTAPVSETVTVTPRAAVLSEKDADLETEETESKEIDKTDEADKTEPIKENVAEKDDEKKVSETESAPAKKSDTESTVSETVTSSSSETSVQTEPAEETETVSEPEPEPVSEPEPEPEPEPVDPYAGYSYGVGYNGRMKGYSWINSYSSYESDPSAWTAAVQATVDSGVICRCGNYFAGHNPGVMSFISGIGTGETVTIKNNGSAINYRVISINDVGSYDMPDRTFNAICGSSGEICIQFCYGGGLRLVYAVPN